MCVWERERICELEYISLTVIYNPHPFWKDAVYFLHIMWMSVCIISWNVKYSEGPRRAAYRSPRVPFFLVEFRASAVNLLNNSIICPLNLHAFYALSRRNERPLIDFINEEAGTGDLACGRVASRAECHSTQIVCWSRSRLIRSSAICETWQLISF